MNPDEGQDGTKKSVSTQVEAISGNMKVTFGPTRTEERSQMNCALYCCVIDQD